MIPGPSRSLNLSCQVLVSEKRQIHCPGIDVVLHTEIKEILYYIKYLITLAFYSQIIVDDVTVHDNIITIPLSKHFIINTNYLFTYCGKDIVKVREVISTLVFGHATCVKTMTS